MANLITAQEVIELAFAENSNMREESISDTSIRIAEIKYIKPVFGNMYSMLGTTYATFTNEYLKPALAYFVKCEIVSSIAIDMSNSGIAVANPQYQSAASDKQRQRLYDSEMSKAKVLLDDALAYISAHKEEFPDFGGVAPKKHYRNGGLILGGGLVQKSTSFTPDAVSRKEFDALEDRVEDLEQGGGGGGGSTSDNNYTDADKALVQTIPSKQDKLTLTVKDNGNIVIGDIAGQTKEFMPATPSGDPMHYAYEAIGAVYNPTTKMWSYRASEGGLTDLTNADMQVCYGERHSPSIVAVGMCSRLNGRTNFINASYAGSPELYNTFTQNLNIEVFFLKGLNYTTPMFKNGLNLFYNCPKLHTVGFRNEATFQYIDLQYMTSSPSGFFGKCYELREVRLHNLKVSLNLADCSKLSKASILYLVQNASPTSAITITLHSTAYAMAMADADIKAALNNKTLVKLASA